MKLAPTVTPSSNTSAENRPAIVGVDTVALSVPCAVEPLPATGDRLIGERVDPMTGEITQTFQGRRLGMFGGFHHSRLIQSVRGWAVEFECSVPLVLAGHNNDPARPADIGRVLELAAQVLGEEHGIEIDISGAWIRRLDLVRDFHDIDDPGWVLGRLQTVLPDRRDVVALSYLGRTGRVSSVVRHTRDYRVRFYDKSAQSSLSRWPAPAGQLRFELQLRGSALRKLKHPRDLTESGLERLAEHFYIRMGFDSALGESDPDVESLRRAWPLLAAKDQKALPMALGLHLLERAGLTPVQDAKTRRKYRGLPAEVLDHSRGYEQRLDFRTGRLCTSALQDGTDHLDDIKEGTTR